VARVGPRSTVCPWPTPPRRSAHVGGARLWLALWLAALGPQLAVADPDTVYDAQLQAMDECDRVNIKGTHMGVLLQRVVLQ
jgi:hypothetical protein